MGMNVELKLMIDGKQVEGESTTHAKDKTIECLSFEDSVDSARDTHGNVTGRRQHNPIRILKRIDKSSPLLLKALCEAKTVAGEFKFFRPDEKSGKAAHFYTIKIDQANVASVKQMLLNTLRAETVKDPPEEEITFSFRQIEWIYEQGGISHKDTWEATA